MTSSPVLVSYALYGVQDVANLLDGVLETPSVNNMKTSYETLTGKDLPKGAKTRNFYKVYEGTPLKLDSVCKALDVINTLRVEKGLPEVAYVDVIVGAEHYLKGFQNVLNMYPALRQPLEDITGLEEELIDEISKNRRMPKGFAEFVLKALIHVAREHDVPFQDRMCYLSDSKPHGRRKEDVQAVRGILAHRYVQDPSVMPSIPGTPVATASSIKPAPRANGQDRTGPAGAPGHALSSRPIQAVGRDSIHGHDERDPMDIQLSPMPDYEERAEDTIVPEEALVWAALTAPDPRLDEEEDAEADTSESGPFTPETD